MHELVLLLAMIGLLLGVLAGLALVFRGWLIRRAELMAEAWDATAAPAADVSPSAAHGTPR